MTGHYIGAAYPLQTGLDGRIVVATDEDLAKGWLEQFILSSPGWRPFSDFGAGLPRYLFRQNTDKAKALLQSRITMAQDRFPVIIDEVTFERSDDDPAKSYVRVTFHLRGRDSTATITVDPEVPSE